MGFQYIFLNWPLSHQILLEIFIEVFLPKQNANLFILKYLFLIFKLNLFYVLVRACGWMGACMHLEVRGQLVGFGSLFPAHGY